MFKNVDLCLFFKTEKVDEKSIHYFTGIHTDLGILLKYKRRQILYLSSLEAKPKKPFPIKDFNIDAILKQIRKSKPKTIGLHYRELTKKQFDFFKKELKGIKLVDVSDEVTKLRTIKKDEEVNYLRKAIKITESIILALSKNIKKFTYEVEAIQFVKQKMIKHNVVESFPTIVATGTHSKNPHYVPKVTSRIQQGFCIVDMGVKYKGYCADITRTFYIGRPKEEEINFYNKIRDELYDLEKRVKPGMKKFQTSFKMVHLIGHGIGLDVHEYPAIGYELLEEGMCVAMEPAIYTNKYGVRIEDDYQLTKTGVRRLSKSSRDLIVI